MTYRKWMAISITIWVASLFSCSGEDRSEERPSLPFGVTVVVEGKEDSCILHGHVAASHNSTLTSCGFFWGNDTLSATLSQEGSFDFSDTLKNLETGDYYVVAYATNRMGTTTSDTAIFKIP